MVKALLKTPDYEVHKDFRDPDDYISYELFAKAEEDAFIARSEDIIKVARKLLPYKKLEVKKAPYPMHPFKKRIYITLFTSKNKKYELQLSTGLIYEDNYVFFISVKDPIQARDGFRKLDEEKIGPKNSEKITKEMMIKALRKSWKFVKKRIKEYKIEKSYGKVNFGKKFFKLAEE